MYIHELLITWFAVEVWYGKKYKYEYVVEIPAQSLLHGDGLHHATIQWEISFQVAFQHHIVTLTKYRTTNTLHEDSWLFNSGVCSITQKDSAVFLIRIISRLLQNWNILKILVSRGMYENRETRVN